MDQKWTYSGGTIQRLLLVPSLLRSGMFVCTTNRKVNILQFYFVNSKITNFENNLDSGTQFYLAVCEEDSIYVIQKKYYAANQEEKEENCVWRKSETTVRQKNIQVKMIISIEMNFFSNSAAQMVICSCTKL